MLVALGYFFRTQIALMAIARMKWKPQMDVIPKPMSVASCSVPATTFNAFDCRFSVPWSDCSQIRSTTSGVAWACSGTNVTLVCFAPRSGVYSSIFSDVSGEKSRYSLRQRELLALKNVENPNFYICKKVWEVTPRDISLFKSKGESADNFQFLVLKVCGISSDVRNAYFFEHGDVKGFQLGKVSSRRFIELSIFDQMDREIRLAVLCATNSPVPLTQSDINTIITTFSVSP